MARKQAYPVPGSHMARARARGVAKGRRPTASPEMLGNGLAAGAGRALRDRAAQIEEAVNGVPIVRRP